MESHIATLSAGDCWIIALRAHDAVLALEATPTDANRSERWRLHALAATLGECAGLARAPFYGEVAGQVVDLHDLRNAQLLREDRGLASGGFGTVADARREYAQHYLDMASDPASAAPEDVLGLLRAPLAGSAGR